MIITRLNKVYCSNKCRVCNSSLYSYSSHFEINTTKEKCVNCLYNRTYDDNSLSLINEEIWLYDKELSDYEKAQIFISYKKSYTLIYSYKRINKRLHMSKFFSSTNHIDFNKEVKQFINTFMIFN